MRELYARVAECAEESEVNVRLSYLEIYNETIRDLLSPIPTPDGAGLALREDSASKMSVVGITEHIPENPDQVLDMITEGNKRRTMSPTEANAVSSRSHAVLQINVTQRPRTASTTEQTTSASLNIIDLAGSERAAATRNNGQRMKEGANINKSLLALGNCINALCQSGGQKGRHVPYRNSKLTRLLKFSLGGNCKTVMIVCVSPSSAHFEETHNTLKYANQAKNIRTKVTRNMMNVDRHVAQYVQAIHELNEEVAELKRKLAERGTLESATEKRRKVEIAKEVEDAKSRMKESTEQVKRFVLEKAGCEAVLKAAELRRSSHMARLADINAELRLADAGNPPGDLTSEKAILERLIAKEDATLADSNLQGGVRALNNSIQMQQGIIIAASHNTRFDAEASETIRNLGATLQAGVESLRYKVKFDALIDAIQQENGLACTMTTVATRCTVAVKEAAGELEYRAGAISASSGGAEEQGELASTLTSLAQQFRDVGNANDETFMAMTGAGTVVVQQQATTSAPRSTTIKRARVSLAPAVTSASSSAEPVAGRRAGPTTRRSSVAPSASTRNLGRPGMLSPIRASPRAVAPAARVAASYAAPTAASRAHLANSPRRVIASPRRLTRRQSAMPATSRRGSTALGSAAAGTARTNTKAGLAPSAAKKAFRWADEAGEGSIDDAKKSAQPSPLRLTETIEESQTDTGSSSSDLEQPRIQSNHEWTAGSSSTEWEDIAQEKAKKPSVVAARRVPASGGLFNREHLAKKAAAQRSASAGSVESSTTTLSARKASQGAPDSSDDSGAQQPRRASARIRNSLNSTDAAAPARVAFSDVRNVSGPQVITDDDNPFDENSPVSIKLRAGANFSAEAQSAESRGTPYKRRESGGGVGPVRRARGRMSASGMGSPASVKLSKEDVSPLPPLPSIFASIAKERDALAAARTTGLARGPPNNTAARAAALAAAAASQGDAESSDAGSGGQKKAAKGNSAVRVPLTASRSSIYPAGSKSASRISAA